MAEESSRECLKCGACCQGFLFSMPVADRTLDLLSAHYGRKYDELRLQLKHRCVHLAVDNLCKIYEERPTICKEHICRYMKNGEGERILLLYVDERHVR